MNNTQITPGESKPPGPKVAIILLLLIVLALVSTMAFLSIRESLSILQSNPTSETQEGPKGGDEQQRDYQTFQDLLPLLPNCALRESGTGDLTYVDSRTVHDLTPGLSRTTETAGYHIRTACIDKSQDLAFFLLARPVFTDEGKEVLVTTTDEGVFLVVDTQTEDAQVRRQDGPLGFYQELSAGTYYRVDHIERGETLVNTQLFLIQGSGEGGGLTDWLHYDFASGELTVVQHLTQAPDTYEIYEPELLKEFRFATRAQFLDEEEQVSIKTTDISVCNTEPIETDIGRMVYPSFERYDFTFLGPLFTADDCGGGRIDQIFGVADGMYTLGARIRLANVPSEDLRTSLTEIGFQCSEETETLQNCREWRLDEPVPLENILKLKPFADQIDSVDCINCG